MGVASAVILTQAGRFLTGVGNDRACQARPVFLELRFFDSDLMIMWVERVRGKLTPECLIAALISAWISP